MRLIGLTGHAGAGKDTAADLISEVCDAYKMAFAATLRFEVAWHFQCSGELFTDRSRKDTDTEALALSRCDVEAFRVFAAGPRFAAGASPRAIMQKWGDFRRACDPDYFLTNVRETVRWYQGTARRQPEAIVITDVRFPNEADMVRSHGGQIWRITRPGIGPVNGHASERTDLLQADLELANDGSVDALRRKISDVMSTSDAS